MKPATHQSPGGVLKGSIASRYAVRSLGRNTRRTLLSVIGIGIGVAIGLVAIGWIRGERGMFVRLAAESGTGHMRIAPRGWKLQRDPDMRLADAEAELAAARALPVVKVATPRARADGLLALGTRVAGVQMVGVDPQTEPRALRFVRDVDEGRYLRPDDRGAVVLGKALAQRLDAGLDDELVVTMVGADGGMQSMLLLIVGIVDTGSRDIDLTICHVVLADLEELSGEPGAGEIVILLNDAERIPQARAELARQVDDHDEVLRWEEVAPELNAGVSIDEAWTRVTVAILLFVVLLGVASAQLTAVLQRRKEFAVLAALGMRGRTMVRLVLTEGLALGVAGTLVALLLGAPAVYYLATWGVDLQALAGEAADISVSGVLLDPVFYADFGWWVVPYALVLSITATVLASFYPAWFAARTDPASALRVAQ